MNIKKLLPLIGIGIFFYILLSLDFNRIFEIFSNLNFFYVFLCFFAFIPLLLLVNVEWQLILHRQKIKVSFWYSIKNFFVGYFYGFTIPGGFGAYLRSLYLAEESGSPLPKCISNVIIFNAVEFTTVLILGAIGALLFSSFYPHLFVMIIIVLIVVFVLYWFFFEKSRSKHLFMRLGKIRIFESYKNSFERDVDSFYEDLPGLKDVLLPFSLSVAGWFLKYIIMFFIAKMFFVNIPIVTFIFIIAISEVVSSLPVSIYGLGTRDAALIYMFSLFGVSKEEIISVSLFWFTIFWIYPTIIGAFVTFYETRKFNKKFKLDEQNCRRFERYMKRFPEMYSFLAGFLKEYLSDIKNPIIVDLGMGPGLLSKEINKVIPDAEIIGIDPSQHMLKIAKENAEVKTFLATSENIPLDDNTVDLLVTRFSLAYWKNPRKSIKEISRVLKPEGKIVIEALNKNFPSWKLFILKIKWILKTASFDITKYFADAYKTAYSIESIKKLMIESDFKIVRTIGKKKDWKVIVAAEKKRQ